MTSFLFGLRLGRSGAIGFSIAAMASVFVQTVGYYQIAGHTPAERAAFGESMTALAAQFVALFPAPIRPETVGGYVEFRGFHPLAILIAVWALASATGFARGDEERGITEAILATGTTRAGVVVSRAGAFAASLAVAALAAGAGFVVGVATGHESVATGGVLEEAALLVAIGLACYAISLLVAQLSPARSATAAAGAVLLALFLVNGLSRVLGWVTVWRWLSPFRYYDLSQPLPPGGTFDVRGFAALLTIAIAATGAAALAFAHRDIGSPLVAFPTTARRPSHKPSANPVWRLTVVRGVYEGRHGLLAWSVGMAAVAALFVLLTRTMVNVMLQLPTLLPYVSTFVHQRLYPSVLGYTYFNVAQLLFAGLAIAQVARWSADEASGRTEIALSQPYSRAALVLERMAVLIAVGLVVAAASGATLALISHFQGIDLDSGRVVAASFMLVPFALVFAGAGALVASWKPRAAVAVLGTFAFASYVDTELATIFKLPAWVQDLSAFKLFGTPLLNGIDGRNLTLTVALAVLGTGSSILLMQRRDIGA